MTLESLQSFATNFDDAFFLIGATLLILEILKGVFTGSLKGREILDMIASVTTQIPYLLVETFLLAFAYYGFVWFADTYVTWSMPVTWSVAALAILAADFVYYWEHRLAHGRPKKKSPTMASSAIITA